MGPDDVGFLLTPAGAALLALASDLDWSAAGRIASTQRVRAADADHAAAAIDVVTARLRARGRLRGADRWLLTDEAVQQATAWPVAAARARRLASRPVHDVTCSVGAELGELVRECPRVVGSDLDPVRARMAAHNVPGALVAVGDALAPASRDTVVLADPARRSGGRRLHDPDALSPPLPALLDALGTRDHAVKCAPGLDTGALGHVGEVELVSLDGGVREACLWSPGLSTARRRATVLRGSGYGSGTGADPESGFRTETIVDTEPDELPEPDGADQYIVDPDGAVVRAGLVRHWAHRHGLRQLDPRIAHLTGPAIPAGYSGFEVLSRHRLDRKELRRVLKAAGCGSLEILVRGVDVDPDSLRKGLPTSGDRPMALAVTRIGRDAVVFVCGPRTRTPDAPSGIPQE